MDTHIVSDTPPVSQYQPQALLSCAEHDAEGQFGLYADPLGDAMAVARGALERTNELDTLAPDAPVDCPDQMCLDLAQRIEGGRGGATKRPPPPVEFLLAAVCERPATRRPNHDFGVPEEIANAPDEQVAAMLHYVYEHRGRRMGCSKRDYAWQMEWTQARALEYGFFHTRKMTLSDDLSLSDTLAATLLGDGDTPTRRRMLAILITADRMRKTGATIAAPDLAVLLGGVKACAISTVWETIRWLEVHGYLFRMHRFKPSKKEGGPPVRMGANFYGLGLNLLRFRPLYLLAQECLDLEAAAYEKLRQARRKSQARYRRQRRETCARRRGEAVPPRPGRVMPSRREYAAMVVEGHEARENARSAIDKADRVREDELDRQARAVMAGELEDIEVATKAVAEAEAVARAEAVEAVSHVGGLERVEAPEGDVVVAALAEVQPAPVEVRASEGGSQRLTGSETTPAEAGAPLPVEGRQTPKTPSRDTIRLSDGTVPFRRTGNTRKDESRTSPPKLPPGSPRSSRASQGPPRYSSLSPSSRAGPMPPSPNRAPSVAPGGRLEGKSPGAVGHAAASVLEADIAGLKNRELADLLRKHLGFS